MTTNLQRNIYTVPRDSFMCMWKGRYNTIVSMIVTIHREHDHDLVGPIRIGDTIDAMKTVIKNDIALQNTK